MSTLPPVPYWDAISLPAFPPPQRSFATDVVVIGGGITGITSALLLKEAGCRVALVERGRVGGIDTTCTTAHLASVVDASLADLASRLGRDHAQAVWDAGWAAIHQIDELVDRFDIACDFTWVPGFLHVPVDAEGRDLDREQQRVRDEAALAQELEFDASYVEGAPVVRTPAMRVEHQAKFHPRKYLRALLARLPGETCEVFEESAAVITDDGVRVGSHTIRAPWIVMATHNPLQGGQSFLQASALQTRLALYTSYVVRARVPEHLDDALFWDTRSPYHYLRIDKVEGETYAIAGGSDHKTGQIDDPERCYAEVEQWLKRVVPDAQVTGRWSGQVIETPDLLPIIGTVADRQFVATGFAGNGMTFGTLSAMIARDLVTNAANPWQNLFDTGRSLVRRGPWKYLTENIDYPYYLIRDRFAGAGGRSLRSLARDTGDVIDVDGTVVAAYRNPDGRLVTLSPTCTHLGCRVHWNQLERAWECPCHGSRFEPTGAVISGPAEEPLQAVNPSGHPDSSQVSTAQESRR
jgi:glycine/D-amino acid oxidase-like deaminating enzyme/nitrite reductase/ring-hydroxylating ferredoxin subunit